MDMENSSSSPDDPMVARYHDGELGPDDRTEAERRLDASLELRDELQWYRRLGAGLRHGAPDRSPAGLGPRIMSKIRAMGNAESPLVSLLPMMRRLAVAAAVLVLIVSAFFVLQHGSEEPGFAGTPQLVQVERPSLDRAARISVTKSADLLQ